MYPVIGIIVRVILLLLLLYLMIRWLGKKHLTQMTIIEYISGIVLGGVVAIHISSTTYPLLHGVIAMIAWTLMIVGIETISLKSERFRDVIHGKSKVLIADGEFIYDHLKGERMTKDELLESLRTRNIDQLSDVEFAQLEPSGKLNVRTYSDESSSYYKNEDLEHLQHSLKHLINQVDSIEPSIKESDLRSWIEQLKEIDAAFTKVIAHSSKDT